MKLPRVPGQREPEQPDDDGEAGPPVGVAQRARGSRRRPFPVPTDLRRAIDAPTMRDTLLPAMPGPQVAEDSLVLRVLDLALRVGEVQLAAGAGAAVAHDTMLGIATAYGLPVCDVDIAFSTITMCCHRGVEAGPVTTMRNVRYRTQDYTRLASVDAIIHDVVDRENPITVDAAFERLGAAVDSDHPYPRFLAGIARSAVAGSVALLIGGGWAVALTAFLVTGVIWGVTRWMRRRRVPMFFQQIVGAGVVTGVATLLAYLEVLDDSPAYVVGAGLVVLLSGLALVGLVQDAITGFPLTAAGRAVEVVLASAGLFVGVVVSIKLVSLVGGATVISQALTVPPSPTLSLAPLQLVAAAAAAVFFALSAYAPLRSLPVAAVAGVVAWATFAGFAAAGLDDVLAASLAAMVLGLTAMVLPRSLGIPPLVLVVAGVTPMLPGLTLYTGFSQLAGSAVAEGVVTVIVALGFALALAAGVSVGEQFGWPLHRAVRRASRHDSSPAPGTRPRIF